MRRLRRNMAHHRPLWLHMPNQMQRRMSTDPPKLLRLVTQSPRPPMRPPNPTTQPHHTSRSLSISPNQNLLTSPADHLTSPNPSTNLDPSTSPKQNTNLSPVTSLNHLTSQSNRTKKSHHHLMNLLLRATKSQHPLMKSQQIFPLTKQSQPTALQRPTNPTLISLKIQDL